MVSDRISLRAALAAACLLLPLCASAATVYDESVSGDLNGQSIGTLALGVNSIFGTTSKTDSDPFSFTVPLTLSVSKFTLTPISYTGSGFISLTLSIAGETPSSVTLNSVAPNLGAQMFTLTPAMSNTTKSFAWTVGGADGLAMTYRFDLLADPTTPVPLPAAAWLLLSGAGALAAFARRRKPAA